MKKRWVGFSVVPLSFIASLAFANAFFNPGATVTSSLTWNGFSNGSVTANITGTAVPGGSLNISSGQFFGFFDGDQNGLGADDFFRFFCVDIADRADTTGTADSYTRTPGAVPPFSATQSAQLTRLFNQFYPNPTTATYFAGGSQTNFGDFGANTQASAAFQLAVLDILFDNDMNLSTSGNAGAFNATSPNSAMIAQAQNELNAVGTGSTPAPGWNLFTFTTTSASPGAAVTAPFQTFISVETVPTLLQTAPEPGTPLLLCAALLAFWAVTARRRRQPL